MYCKIGTQEYDPDFSYIIMKHPENRFERETRSGGKVIGYFEDPSSFHLYIENDPLNLLTTMRQMNLSNYVHTQLSAVCPFNLKGFDVCFRSVLRGNPSGFDEEKFKAPKKFMAEIGPFPNYLDQIRDTFEPAGLIVEDCISTRDEFVNCVVLENEEPMPATEFFQKIYLLSYYLTIRHTLGQAGIEQIDKFVKFCESWIAELPDRNKIINRLTQWNKGKMLKFEKLLIEKSDDSEAVKKDKHQLVEEALTKRRLHTVRHDICEYYLDSEDKTFMELGCGGGKLLRFLAKKHKNLKITGLEVKGFLASKNNRSKKARIINTDILYPRIDYDLLMPDYLALIEVIEHLDEKGRERIINLIKKMYVPKHLMISVPNIEYNKYFEFLEPGELRHPDHKVEYDRDRLQKEIIEPLSEMYDVIITPLKPFCEHSEDFSQEECEPSWMLHCTHKDSDKRQINKKIYNNIQHMYESLYLPISNYNITGKEVSEGYTSAQVQYYRNEIFYLGATIPPVEYDEHYGDYLEHPESAFKYYADRGILKVWAEEKYMGSRGYIMAFRDPEQAKEAGFNSPIFINSRQGFPFFKEDEVDHVRATVDIYKEIQATLEFLDSDFIMLDCEIMPWSLKGKGLIDTQFRSPGECAFLSRKMGKYGDQKAALDYLTTLGKFIKDDPLEVRAFHVIAIGKLGIDKRHGIHKFTPRGTTLGCYKDRTWHYDILSKFKGDIVKCVQYYQVDTTFSHEINSCVKAWERFCVDGEGFVIKLDKPLTYASNGYLLQPALKVRGKDYLRLIYGIDYLEPSYFEKVTKRGIRLKRIQAIQQYELANILTRAYVSYNSKIHLRALSAFYGMNSVNFRNVDATL